MNVVFWIIGCCLSFYLQGTVLSATWNWFVAEVFGGPVLTWIQGYGLGLVFMSFLWPSIAREVKTDDNEKIDWGKAIKQICIINVGWLVIFGLAWITRCFS